VTNKEGKPVPTKKIEQKDDFAKKNVNTKDLINKTAEENAKIKPTKNYLDSDLTQKKYKDEQAEVAKPEFKNAKVKDEQGEHFVNYDKSQDVNIFFLLKNILALFKKFNRKKSRHTSGLFSSPRGERKKEGRRI
jgi:hypothetical protein